MTEPDLERVAKAYERAQRAEADFRKSRRELREAMRRARASGASYAAIGKAAGGITRQRVAEILED